MARGDYQSAAGHKPNNTYVPALVNPPTLFIASSEHTVSGGEIWMAVSCNDTNYGGCVIHASNDGGHYYIIGRMRGKSTHGVLTAALPAATGTDTTHTLAVDVHLSGGTINAVSQTTLDTHDSLCYVGGEFLAYKDAALNLSGIGYYNLNHLERGLYGSTPGAAGGAAFVLCNEQLFKYRFNRNLAGKTIYLKFQGFNGVESGYQDLADLTAYPFYVSSDGGVKALQSDITLLQEAIGALPGAPSNNPVPSGIQVINRVNGSREITLVWDAYSQGPLKANYLAVFFKPVTTPGELLTTSDPARLVSVRATSEVFSGLSPDVEYKFGIAAVKVVGSTVESTAIIQPTASPDWLVAAGSVDFTGKIGGIEVGTVLFDLNAAKDNISSILGDGQLSPLEKNGIRKEWEGIVDEKGLLDAQADAYAITAKKTAYDNAYTALGNYLNNTTAPGWNTATIPLWINDTNITVITTLPGTTPAAAKTAYRAAWVAYYNARIALTQEIADRAKAIADAAKTTANTATTAAAAAQTAANAANSDLYDIAKDNVLSKLEKKRVILDYNAILDEKADIDAKAVDMGLGSNALKIAYDDAIAHAATGLTAYLATLTTPTAWNDLSDLTGGKTTIDGPTFRAKFKAVYTARQALLNAITAEAANRAVWSTGVTGKPGSLDGYSDTLGNITAGIATFTDTFSSHNTLDGIIDATVGASSVAPGVVHGFYGHVANSGYGVMGANWLNASGVGGGVYGVSKSTDNGAGVYARNKSGGPALKVEGPMTIDDGTLVVNLNSYKLEGHRASYFAIEPTYGYLPLNSAYKIATTYLPDSILGQLQYKGPFNASNGNSVWTGANIGAASADNKGWYYIVTTPGSYSVTDSSGAVINSWQVGDWIVSGGAAGGWDKIDNTDAISSYNGRTGAITSESSDITSATGLTLAAQTNGFTINGGNTTDYTLTIVKSISIIGSGGAAVLSINGSGGTIGTAAYTDATAYATAAQGAKADNAVTPTGIETLTNKTLTAPVLTTPTLGAPASGWLANCGGYSFSALTGVPTTLTGYGITNAYTKTESGSLFAPIAHVGDAGVNAHPLAVAGTSAGFMSASDKTKLDGIASGATNNTGTVTSVSLSLPSFLSVSGSPVTSSGTLTASLASQIQNQVLAAPTAGNGTPAFRYLVANDLPSIPNTQIVGLGTLATQSGTFSGTHSGTSSGTNTGDNSPNSLYSGLVTNATHTGDATGATALTVKGINGVLLSTLGTGILKNTTGTGVPSIAGAADFPILNQNTTGSAGSVSGTGVITGTNIADGTITAAKVASGIVTNTGSAKQLGGTGGSPANGTTRSAWMVIVIGTTTYYLPLYL